ncbi:hypothetical protein ACFQX7_25295 [Luedemannella flava]
MSLPPEPALTAGPPPGLAADQAALGAAAPPVRRTGRWRGLLLGLLIAVIAISGVVLLGYVGNRIGPVALAVGVGAAVLPVPVLVSCFLWLDRYDPEPVRLLLFCFLWGRSSRPGSRSWSTRRPGGCSSGGASPTSSSVSWSRPSSRRR